MFYGCVCGFLRLFLLFRGHIRIAIGYADRVFACEYFVPDARCRVAAVYVVEMVSVAAECVAKRMACVLYGSAAGNEQKRRMLLQDIARAGKDAVVHNGLAAAVAGESRVGGGLCIRPRLEPAEACLRLIKAHAVDKHTEIGFVTALYAAVVACLLHGDIVPPVQAERLTERVGFVERADSVLYDTETICGGIFVEKLPVLLQ